jgi:hypothetical protein
MELRKKKDTYNDYTVSLSWGQLNAIYKALEKSHADAIADETFAEIGFYLQNVAGPGQDEEEFKAAKDAEKQASEEGDEAGVPNEDGGRDPELVGKEIGAEEEPQPAAEPEEAPAPGNEADDLLERPPTRE